MTFKTAKCPNCGSTLQLPDDLTKVKCMYCGADEIVREAIQLAAGRVKEFTTAEPIQSEMKVSPEVIGKSKFEIIAALFIGILFLVGAVIVMFAARQGGAFLSLCGGVLILVSLIFFAAGIPKQSKPAKYETVHSGWKGECPYCSTAITLPLTVGADCYACKNRIVIRDEKFYSVDTPMSGLRVES